jgi:hypothetical protein
MSAEPSIVPIQMTNMPPTCGTRLDATNVSGEGSTPSGGTREKLYE